MSAEFVDSGHDQLPMRTILQASIFADFLIVFITRQIHSENRVVVICTREFGGGIGDKHLNQFFDIHSTSANYLHAHTMVYVSWFYCFLICHELLLGNCRRFASKPSTLTEICKKNKFASTIIGRHPGVQNLVQMGEAA